jgi:hypothetical protein
MASTSTNRLGSAGLATPMDVLAGGLPGVADRAPYCGGGFGMAA